MEETEDWEETEELSDYVRRILNDRGFSTREVSDKARDMGLRISPTTVTQLI